MITGEMSSNAEMCSRSSTDRTPDGPATKGCERGQTNTLGLLTEAVG